MKAPDSFEPHAPRERKWLTGQLSTHAVIQVTAQVDGRGAGWRRVTGGATVRGAVLDLKRIILRDLVYREHAFRVRS